MASFSDDFTRANADSLGANWSEVQGDADIFSNSFRLSTGSFGNIFAIYTGTPCDTNDQYLKVTTGVDSQYPLIGFRSSSDGSEAFYGLYIDGGTGNVQWYSFVNKTDSGTEIQTLTIASSSWVSSTIGAVIKDAAGDTRIYIWKNPTGDAPDSGGLTWGSASPGLTFNTNPGGSGVNTGAHVLLGGVQGSPDTVRLFNFFAGDVPGGGGGGTIYPNFSELHSFVGCENVIS